MRVCAREVVGDHRGTVVGAKANPGVMNCTNSMRVRTRQATRTHKAERVAGRDRKQLVRVCRCALAVVRRYIGFGPAGGAPLVLHGPRP